MDERLGELAERDVPVGDDDCGDHARSRRVRGRRRRRVTGRRAHDDLRALLGGLRDGDRHPAVLERTGGIRALDLEQHARADLLGEPRRVEQRRVALVQRDDRRAIGDREAIAVHVDDPPRQYAVGRAVTRCSLFAADDAQDRADALDGRRARARCGSSPTAPPRGRGASRRSGGRRRPGLPVASTGSRPRARRTHRRSSRAHRARRPTSSEM